MSVYARFKRNPDGLRKLVELLEGTAPSKRQKMIEVGMAEDAEYTNLALQYMMTFEDVVGLPDSQLAEVCTKAPARMIGYAIAQLPGDVQKRFLSCCSRQNMFEVKDMIGINVGPREISGAQIKLVQVARELEGKGLVRVKKIPFSA